jgi:hypothetical protein
MGRIAACPVLVWLILLPGIGARMAAFGLFLVAAPVEQEPSVVLVYTFLSLPVSLLPLCVFVRYLSRLAGAAARGEPDPPTFESVGALIVEGVGFAFTYGLYFVVWFVLWIVPAMAIVAVTGNRTLTMMYGMAVYLLCILGLYRWMETR